MPFPCSRPSVWATQLLAWGAASVHHHRQMLPSTPFAQGSVSPGFLFSEQVKSVSNSSPAPAGMSWDCPHLLCEYGELQGLLVDVNELQS